MSPFGNETGSLQHFSLLKYLLRFAGILVFVVVVIIIIIIIIIIVRHEILLVTWS